MLYALFGTSVLSTLVISIASKTNKILKWLVELFCFVFMFILLGWAAGAYDIEIGISRYVNYQQYPSYTEVGFNYLVSLGHSLGWTYRQFYVFWSFVELLILFYFIHQNSKKSELVIFMFLLFPMVMVFQYTRNNIAFAFCLLAFNCLIKKKKFYLFKYIFFVLIASSIHISSLFFLMYLPYYFCKNNKLLIFLTIILTLVLFSIGNFSYINDVLYSLIDEKKVDMVNETTAYFGMFGRVAALLVSIIEFWLSYLLLKYEYRVKMKTNFDKFAFVMNLTSFLYIPLTLKYGAGFSRMVLLLSSINYCYIIKKATVLNRSQKITIYSFLILCIFVLIFANFRNAELRESVLIPFFENNELIGG